MMRTRLLLSLCLAAMPFALAGCDSGSETTVGTGMKEPPPEAQAAIKEREDKYKQMMEDQKANPTPTRDGAPAPPPGG